MRSRIRFSTTAAIASAAASDNSAPTACAIVFIDSRLISITA